MKKLFWFLPLAALLFAAACEKDDDDLKVEPYIIEIPEYVNNQSYVLHGNHTAHIRLWFFPKITCIANCTESTMKIELPGILAKKYLTNIQNFYWPHNDVTISDPTAKIGIIQFYHILIDSFAPMLRFRFDGDFIYGDVTFCYSDRDVFINTYSVNGFFMEFDNVTLKKGWNKIACRCYKNQTGSEYYVYSMDIPDDAYWQFGS